MNNIGILQGRLLPKSPGQLQIFPADTWEAEFKIAEECGFSAIELLFDIKEYDRNPLMSESGRNKIIQLTETGNLTISSVCADFFRKYGLFSDSKQVKEGNISILKRLINASSAIGCNMILLPFFEETEIRNMQDKKDLSRVFENTFELLEENAVNLCLETTLPALELVSFLGEIDHPNIKVYYDLGNSIPLKYNAPEDIRYLDRWISGIHIKDRDYKGQNVILGTGLVDFKECFKALREINYQGEYILETVPGDIPIKTAKQHLHFVTQFL